MRLRIAERLREFDRAAVMGIVNLTTDSFFAGSRVDISDLCGRVDRMLGEGADIIDLGACSTRPGSAAVDESIEFEHLVTAVKKIRSEFGDSPIISVDTYRSRVARECVAAGADIINDISGGDLDPEMFATVAELKVPYVLMHMRGTPADMQTHTDYADVSAEVLQDIAFKLARLRQLGVADVIVDPGFGFAKTLDQNYRLMHALPAFKELNAPVLAGISRKSMICTELGITSAEALNGTTALNMIALMQGADILRVHDVKEAVETVRIFEAYRRNRPDGERLIEILN